MFKLSFFKEESFYIRPNIGNRFRVYTTSCPKSGIVSSFFMSIITVTWIYMCTNCSILSQISKYVQSATFIVKDKFYTISWFLGLLWLITEWCYILCAIGVNLAINWSNIFFSVLPVTVSVWLFMTFSHHLVI